ncbi:MAG: DUF6798 domain-containing protein [Bryobacteraceae bacterium]
MTEKWLLGAVVFVLTSISFFYFPGHTILQSDTQIYLPILEHFWDPSALTRDIVAINPHVAFTIYDEVAIALRKVTGVGFEGVLMGQQFVYRALGIAGLLLIGTGVGLAGRMAALLAALVSLGATITGPAVLTVEYEPVPRGFAIALLILALGLMLHRRWTPAAVAAGLGFLYHPPTALAFCLVYAAVLLWRREYRALAVLAGAAVLMAVFVWVQPGISYHQDFFGQVDPELEKLQRMRASYNWISIWIAAWWKHYLLLWIVSLAALWRVRNTLSAEMQIFSLALPLIGALSPALSYLLLEDWKWSLMPQFQPGRYLLMVTFFAVLLAAVAGIRAVEQRRYVEGFLFFLVPVAVPTIANFWQPVLIDRVLVVLILAAVAVAGVRWPQMAVAAALLPFALIPTIGKVRNYQPVHTAEMAKLVDWAKSNTPKDAVFQFADAGQSLYPGIFRARALRALYVDWKSGGQVNFLPAFANEWWRRWTLMEKILPLQEYRTQGIDYVIFQPAHRLKDVPTVYENRRYLVYRD